MHELTERELYQELEYAKSLDEDSGRSILSQFDADQPMLFQTIFGVFPSIIADQNQDMANLFMDLCFEVVCVYQKSFGDTPKFIDDTTWMERQAILLEADFQSFLQAQPLDETKRRALHERLVKHYGNQVQIGLIKFLNESIDEFASYNVSRVPAIGFTQAMIFVVVKLLNNLYDKPVRH